MIASFKDYNVCVWATITLSSYNDNRTYKIARPLKSINNILDSDTYMPGVHSLAYIMAKLLEFFQHKRPEATRHSAECSTYNNF